jgi:hypothetical protein
LDTVRLRESFARVATHGDGLPDVAARHGCRPGREACLAGPGELVCGTITRPTPAGTARDQVHVEDFGWSEP